MRVVPILLFLGQPAYTQTRLSVPKVTLPQKTTLGNIPEKSPTDSKTDKRVRPNPEAEKINTNELTVIPPRIILYPFFNRDIERFSLLIRNPEVLDPVHIRISFPGKSLEDIELYTNNIQWKKIDNYLYLTSIYGKPAEIPIVETFFKLDIGYRYKPEQYTQAQLDIVYGDNVVKIIPVDFISSLQFEYYRDKFIEFANSGAKAATALAIFMGVLLLLLLDLFVIRRRRKKVPLCSTRARFSTLVEDTKTIYIHETKNPFGCRLGGLKKKVKITYKNSNIYVKIGGKGFIYPDRTTVSMDINQYWKIRIESQNYFGNDEKSHRNLVILLLPTT